MWKLSNHAAEENNTLPGLVTQVRERVQEEWLLELQLLCLLNQRGEKKRNKVMGLLFSFFYLTPIPVPGLPKAGLVQVHYIRGSGSLGPVPPGILLFLQAPVICEFP